MIILFFILLPFINSECIINFGSFKSTATQTLNNANFFVQTTLGTNTNYTYVKILAATNTFVANTRQLADLRTTPSLWTPPTTTGTVSIVSTSASDTLAGVGCRTVILSGLSTSNIEQSETINLSGTTPVVSVNTYSFVYSLLCSSLGSTAEVRNIGTITATAFGAPQVTLGLHAVSFTGTAGTLGVMPFGTVISWTGIYRVPANKVFYLTQFSLAAGTNGVTNTDSVTYFIFYQLTSTSPIMFFENYQATNVEMGTSGVSYKLFQSFPAGCTIWIEASSPLTTYVASGSLTGILRSL